MSNWNKLRDRAYQTAKAHGFHKGDESVQHYLCLVVTELAEAVEADRKRKRANMYLFEQNKDTKQPAGKELDHWCWCFTTLIKDSLEDELADSTIRLLDLSGMIDMDLEKDVDTRIQRIADEMEGVEWNSKSFTEKIWDVINILTSGDLGYAITTALAYIQCIGIDLGVDLWKHVELKMEYNDTRNHKHGKEY